MEAFTPEFAALWLTDCATAADLRTAGSAQATQSLSPSQQVALEELAERVSAARSVV